MADEAHRATGAFTDGTFGTVRAHHRFFTRSVLHLQSGVGGRQHRSERWPLYEKWLCACWQGLVQEVIDELKLAQVHAGVPPDDEELDKKDPRQLVDGLSYLNNNQSRMDYPRYRREGLPITSSLWSRAGGRV